jgi:hypothetical protein
MSSYNAITLRTQKALKAYLDGLSFSWSPTILRGATADTKVLPAVIVQCATADHEQVGFATGNWIASAEIQIRENADDTSEDAHLDHAGDVCDAFVAESVASDITTAAAGVLAVNMCRPMTQSYQIQDRSWVSTLTLMLFVNNITGD